ncbi:DUF805 domain-containing protein [Kordiimonas sp. SCSIO 12610]|uniref:DUF805 domain-containing protein n=1 Tax=Kordiimonas sp. SCSIO 12610 TaxID=2829597 RepID=UPI00210F19AA|nr:DUF805 domain-containing protein [Kordiimonas sp. SCSIO 12610]UTW56246.1 DUF805 domain-containing protein [Kordiimonas sp. SCSIO 12610]
MEFKPDPLEQDSKDNSFWTPLFHTYLYSLRHSFDFKGRATRFEFIVFNVLSWVLLYLSLILTFGITTPFFALLILVANFALIVRRLHDIGVSGLWIIVGFIGVTIQPSLGSVFFLGWLYLWSGSKGENKYGENPRNIEGFWNLDKNTSVAKDEQ